MKLHLGCGNKLLKGYLNTDIKVPSVGIDGANYKYLDIESFPWDIEDNSVDVIRAFHVLEHVGMDSWEYLEIWKEMYRICSNGAIIDIVVPHHACDNFVNDPTHVRKITPEGLAMFSKKFNRECIEKKYSNSTLGLDIDVDFEIVGVKETINEETMAVARSLGLNLDSAKALLRNIVTDVYIKLRAVKD